jgi:hypothetical protein
VTAHGMTFLHDPTRERAQNMLLAKAGLYKRFTLRLKAMIRMKMDRVTQLPTPM